MRPNGTGVRVLTSVSGAHTGIASAVYSPDGKKIAYLQCTGDCGDPQLQGQASIWVMNANGSGKQRIFNGVNGTQPADRLSWSFLDLNGREALSRPLSGPGGLDLAVLRRRRRHEGCHQTARRGGDLVHGAREGFLVRLRRLGEAADLADVLERGAADLFLGRRRLEVVQRSDVATHSNLSVSGLRPH